MHKRKRDALVKTIRKEMEQWYAQQPKEDLGPIGGYCLWWAYHTVEVLKRAGLKAQIQAGTAYWPIVTAAQDDGISPNQFGYKFEYNVGAALKIIGGVLPEMHVWAAIAEDGGGTIIDVTTKYWPERCLRMIGQVWRASKPPDYLWVTAKSMPPLVTYHADMDAIKLAYQILSLTNHPTPMRACSTF
jgi:hypothetical protein